jgi:hypothetical protein
MATSSLAITAPTALSSDQLPLGAAGTGTAVTGGRWPSETPDASIGIRAASGGETGVRLDEPVRQRVSLCVAIAPPES